MPWCGGCDHVVVGVEFLLKVGRKLRKFLELKRESEER